MSLNFLCKVSFQTPKSSFDDSNDFDISIRNVIDVIGGSEYALTKIKGTNKDDDLESLASLLHAHSTRIRDSILEAAETSIQLPGRENGYAGLTIIPFSSTNIKKVFISDFPSAEAVYNQLMQDKEDASLDLAKE